MGVNRTGWYYSSCLVLVKAHPRFNFQAKYRTIIHKHCLNPSRDEAQQSCEVLWQPLHCAHWTSAPLQIFPDPVESDFNNLKRSFALSLTSDALIISPPEKRLYDSKSSETISTFESAIQYNYFAVQAKRVFPKISKIDYPSEFWNRI